MPKKSSRSARRRNRGLMILSILVIGSLALSAVVSLAGPRIVETPTPDILATFLAVERPTLPPTATPASLSAPTVGPAIAPAP